MYVSESGATVIDYCAGADSKECKTKCIRNKLAMDRGVCVGKEGSSKDRWMSESNETRNEVVEMSRKVQREKSGLDGAIIEEQWWRASEMERPSLHTFLADAFMCTVRTTKQNSTRTLARLVSDCLTLSLTPSLFNLKSSQKLLLQPASQVSHTC